MSTAILAGDIGGTKTLLGLFEPEVPRPGPLAVHSYLTLDFPDLPSMIRRFLGEAGAHPAIGSACFGVAGPVLGQVAELTNVPWRVDAREVGAAFAIGRTHLLNDLEALAYGVPLLAGRELHALQPGRTAAPGHIAIAAAGTGFGASFLHRIAERFIPAPSEGGHADFAARTERDVTLLRELTSRYGRAEVEHVVSGPGLVNIHRITHKGRCDARVDLAHPDAPAVISTSALERRCKGCVEALDLFVEAYGAEAGNLALRTVATGGVFIGGGIAPKILPALTTGTFVEAFCRKGPFEAMLRAMPLNIILNADAGLIGAAAFTLIR
jgi:glucokinase